MGLGRIRISNGKIIWHLNYRTYMHFWLFPFLVWYHNAVSRCILLSLCIIYVYSTIIPQTLKSLRIVPTTVCHVLCHVVWVAATTYVFKSMYALFASATSSVHSSIWMGMIVHNAVQFENIISNLQIVCCKPSVLLRQRKMHLKQLFFGIQPLAYRRLHFPTLLQLLDVRHSKQFLHI